MKSKIKIALLVSLFSAVTAIADTIEIRDVGKKELEGGKTAFVKTEKIQDSSLYAGYRIDLEKKSDGKIHGLISWVSVEGFVELEEKKLSPITKFKELEFVISESGKGWIIISPEKDTKLEIRWIK